MTLTILLGCVLVLGAYAQSLDVNDITNKVTWTGNLLGVAVGVVATTVNLWAGLLIATYFLTQSMVTWVIGGPVNMEVQDVKGNKKILPNVMLMSGPMPSDIWKRTGMAALGMSAAYAVLAPAMTVSMVTPLLSVLALVGSLVGVWAIYDLQYHQTYPHELFGGKWVMTGKVLPGKFVTAGQNMPNHAQSVAMMGLAALAGLAWMGHGWVLVFAPLPAATLVICGGFHVTQGALHFAVLLGAALWLRDGWLGTLALVGFPLGVVALGWWKTKGNLTFDSFRLWLWKESLLRWWKGSWMVRVFGVGSGRYTEFLQGAQHPACVGVQFTTAHNEFVQQMVERGLLGVVLLVLYLGDALWRTGLGSLEQQAVFLLGMTLVSIATVNFPWTLVHELKVMSRPHGPPEYIGSPSLVAISVVVALLAEAR